MWHYLTQFNDDHFPSIFIHDPLTFHNLRWCPLTLHNLHWFHRLSTTYVDSTDSPQHTLMSTDSPQLTLIPHSRVSPSSSTILQATGLDRRVNPRFLGSWGGGAGRTLEGGGCSCGGGGLSDIVGGGADDRALKMAAPALLLCVPFFQLRLPVLLKMTLPDS